MGRGYWLPPRAEHLEACDGFYIDSRAVYTKDIEQSWSELLERLCKKAALQRKDAAQILCMEIVRELYPKRILECIDMNVRSNPHVQKAQAKIRSICMPLCEECRPFTWPQEQKDVDDWLLFEKLKREHLGDVA